MHSHKFIFLCGLHRSGTSPLFRLLREHPEISGFRDTGVPEEEGQHLQNVFLPASAYGGPGQFGFTDEAHLTEKSALISDENRERLFAQWARYWDVSKPYLMEKSPPNLIRTRFLQALFPESYFVVLYRHPIAASFATRKWSSNSLELLFEHWVRCHALFEEDRPYLRRVHVLKYENLIRDTSGEITKICEFVGLPGHCCSPLNREGNSTYFAMWQDFMSGSANPEAGHIVSKYESEVRRHGYSLVDYWNKELQSV